MFHSDTRTAIRQNVTQEFWRRVRLGIFSVALSISLTLGFAGFASNAVSALQIAEPTVTYQQAQTSLTPQFQALMHPHPFCAGTPSDCH